MDATTWSLATPLHLAAQGGHLAVAEALLAAGADLALATGAGQTPLHKAAFEGHDAVAELLLARGSDPNAADQEGYTVGASGEGGGGFEQHAFGLSARAS